MGVDTNQEFNVDAISEQVVIKAWSELNNLDTIWGSQHLSLGDKSSNFILNWKEKVKVLPPYLSENTLQQVYQLQQEADQLLSDARIDEIVFSFGKLSTDEKRKCLSLLQEAEL